MSTHDHLSNGPQRERNAPAPFQRTAPYAPAPSETPGDMVGLLRYLQRAAGNAAVNAVLRQYTMQRAAGRAGTIEPATIQRVLPPVLKPGESGDMPYNQSPHWPQMKQAIEDLGFTVVVKYPKERHQHTVVENIETKDGTRRATGRREIWLGDRTTYSDVEHEYSHIQQQERFRTIPLPSKDKKDATSPEVGYYGTTTKKAETEEQLGKGPPSRGELSDSQNAVGEMEAYMLEFIRLYKRREFETGEENDEMSQRTGAPVSNRDTIGDIANRVAHYYDQVDYLFRFKPDEDDPNHRWVSVYYPHLYDLRQEYREALNQYIKEPAQNKPQKDREDFSPSEEPVEEVS